MVVRTIWKAKSGNSAADLVYIGYLGGYELTISAGRYTGYKDIVLKRSDLEVLYKSLREEFEKDNNA